MFPRLRPHATYVEDIKPASWKQNMLLKFSKKTFLASWTQFCFGNNASTFAPALSLLNFKAKDGEKLHHVNLYTLNAQSPWVLDLLHSFREKNLSSISLHSAEERMIVKCTFMLFSDPLLLFQCKDTTKLPFSSLFSSFIVI